MAAAAGFACAFCGKEEELEAGKRLPKCERCGVARFNDAACAAAGWPQHRKACTPKHDAT